MKKILAMLLVFGAAGLFAEESIKKAPVVTMQLVAENSDEEVAKLEDFLKKGNSFSSYKGTPENMEFIKDDKEYLLIEKDTVRDFKIKDALAIELGIIINFDKSDIESFSEFTKLNINRRVAIFILGQFFTAPKIFMQISNGQIQISGNQKANYKKLAEQLNSL